MTPSNSGSPESGGGTHSLTLYGIDITTEAGTPTGTGTLSFIDPFGGTVVAGGNAASAVVIADATYTTIGGAMFINGGYVGGAANNGQDPDNTKDSSTGFIVTDLAEVVPEPSVLPAALLLFGAVSLAQLGKRSRQRVQ